MYRAGSTEICNQIETVTCDPELPRWKDWYLEEYPDDMTIQAVKAKVSDRTETDASEPDLA